MYLGHRIGAVLLMSGEGKRFGSPIPKQFHLLNGKRIYRYPLETFSKTGWFDEIILVTPQSWLQETTQESGSLAKVVPGGSTRQKSSLLGLKAFDQPPQIVLFHDAVRPFVSQEILQKNIEAAIESGAANTCIASTDTLVFSPSSQKISSIPNRAEYLRGQTPQTFKYEEILKAHEIAAFEGIEDATDDCRLMLNIGHPITIVEGDEKNFKITSEFDLKIASLFFNEPF